MNEGIFTYCEEIIYTNELLMKRYDDASGYSRSHNEQIRTEEAIRCEAIASTFRQIKDGMKKLQAYEEAFSDIKSLPIVWEEGTGIQNCIKIIEKRLEEVNK